MNTRDQNSDDVQLTLNEVQNQLLQDGESWRRLVPVTPEDTVHHVLDTLHAHLSPARYTDTFAAIDEASEGAMQMTQGQAQAPASQRVGLSVYRHKRWIAFGTAAALLITLAAIITIGILQQYSQPFLGLRRPPDFHWSAANVDSTLSPQQAFERGVTLTPCKGQPAKSNKVFWIGTNPHFGLALIQSTCSQDTYILNLIMKLSKNGIWKPLIISGGRRPTDISAQNAAPVPAWLPLPKSINYTQEWTPSESPVVLLGWYTTINIYYGGRISEPITPVAPGESVVVAGKQGQLVQDGDLTTVLVPLSSTETYFFTATASPQETLTLAAAMLTHIAILDSI